MQEQREQIGHFLLAIVVMTWGANFSIIKWAYDDIAPVLFASLRFTVSGILLLAIAFWREKEIRIQKEDIGRLFVVGGLGLGLYQIFWSIGLHLTSASNSALILSLQPLLGALYVNLVNKEPVGKRQYGGMLLALGGVLLVILRPTARLHFSLDTLPGDLLTFMAGLCSSIVFTIWSKPLLKNYSPLRLMGYCMAIGSLTLWMTALCLPLPIAWNQMGEKVWWSMGYAVIFSGIIGHVCWYEGIGRIGATKTLVYLYFITIWAVLFNHFFMGEKISLQQILGGALILWGVHQALRS